MLGLNLGATSSSGGGAYDFGNYIRPDGVNDIGALASAINISATNWVLSWWIQGNASSNTTNANFGYTGGNQYYIYQRHGSTPYFRMSSGSSQTRQDWGAAGLSNWNDSAWHHIYMYSVGVDVHLVYDGVSYGQGGAALNQTGLKISHFFQRQSATSTLPSNTWMDDVIAHDGQGSVTQAQSLYNSGAGEDPTTVFGTTPDYWYKFNVADGTTTIPNSGSAGSNDLTLSNFVTPFIFPR